MKVVYALLIVLIFFGCNKTSTPLSPARKLSGTWTTPNPITLYYSSEGCGSYARYAKFTATIRWDITVRTDNAVDITQTLLSYSANATIIGSDCGLPAPTLPGVTTYVGVISSSAFAFDEQQMLYNNNGGAIGLGNVLIGTFNFTTNNITGTVNEKDCPAYCAGWSTDANTFILTKN
jgi:hypothetical protein